MSEQEAADYLHSELASFGLSRETCVLLAWGCSLRASPAIGATREWQDIETAPKDGTEILGWWSASRTHMIVSWSDDGWWKDCADDCMVNAPTHWGPLEDGPSVSRPNRCQP